jgi:hypothetical protein
MCRNAFASFKSLSLNSHKDCHPTFPGSYPVRETIKLSSVPLIYISRLDVYNIPMPIGSKRKVLITTLRSGNLIILLRFCMQKKLWFEDRYLNTLR